MNKKFLFLIFVFLILVGSVSATYFDIGTKFIPSQTNITYTVVYPFSAYQVIVEPSNITFDNFTFTKKSSTPISLNVFPVTFIVKNAGSNDLLGDYNFTIIRNNTDYFNTIGGTERPQILTDFSKFNEGTFNNTYVEDSKVKVNGSFTKGIFTSKIFDTIIDAHWINMSWNYTESGQFVDDQNTLMLCHFNNDLNCEVGDNSGISSDVGDYAIGLFNTTAVNLTESSSYLIYNATNNNNINVTHGTVEFWFKAQTDFWEDNSTNYLFVAYTNDDNRIYISNPSTNILKFFYKAGGLTKTVTSDISDNFTTEWNHFAFTWDKTADQIKAYVNGQEIGSNNNLGDWNNTLDNLSIYIGTNQNKGSKGLGVYEEFRISDKARNSTEILESYNNRNRTFNLSVSVRSCDDSLCDVESWVNINSSSPQNLNISDNEYFQYKFIMDRGINLLDVNVNYDLPGGNVTGLISKNLIEDNYKVVISKEGYFTKTIEYDFDNFSLETIYLIPTGYMLNCSENESSITFHLLNEEDDNPIVADFDATFYLRPYYSNYSFELNGSNNYSICFTDAFYGYLLDADIEYESPGYYLRNYYLWNYSINNETKDVYLYLINESLAQITIVHSTDENDDALENFLIKVLRYYVGTNSYKTVEISKTNYNGNAITHLIPYNVWYKFLLERNGTIIKEINPTKITNTDLYFTADLFGEYLNSYKKVKDINYNLIYDNVTKTMRFTYSDTNNIVRNACLRVYRQYGLGNIKICESCVNSTASTLICAIPQNTSYTYIGKAYIDTNSKYTEYYMGSIIKNFETDYLLFGNEGLLLSIIIIITLSAIGIWNPTVAITMSIIGLISVVLLKLTFLSIPIVISISIIGIIAIIKNRT